MKSSEAHPPGRRDTILSAALGCFLEKGYRATTIADIRTASGATTGSIYHFFPGKAAMAMALVETAIAGWSMAGPEAAAPAQNAETAIKASVRGLVEWGLANLGLFRFLDEIRATTDDDLAALRAYLEEGQSAARAFYEAAARAGQVRPLPWYVAHALMLGPAQSLLRRIAGGATVPERAAEILADAAWAAVRDDGAGSP